MTDPEAIIDILGGKPNTARCLNVTPQAVCNWIRRGHIPFKHSANIVKAAQGMGVKIAYADLLE
jgi:hypothetical protein